MEFYVRECRHIVEPDISGYTRNVASTYPSENIFRVFFVVDQFDWVDGGMHLVLETQVETVEPEVVTLLAVGRPHGWRGELAGSLGLVQEVTDLGKPEAGSRLLPGLCQTSRDLSQGVGLFQALKLSLNEKSYNTKSGLNNLRHAR